MPETKRRVATIGMFDGVHLGHRSLLRQTAECAAEEHLEPMVVTFSTHPLSLIRPESAPHLLMSLEERVATLRRTVPEVAVLDFDSRLRSLTAREFMIMLRDRFNVGMILMGYNHHFGSDRLSDIEAYRRIGREVGVEISMAREERVPGFSKVSSSVIRRMLLEGDVKSASRALGKDYSITGTVVRGRQLGRTIGFPTANIDPAEDRQLIPAPGVYACRIELPDGSLYPAMVNVGHRPTVETGGRITIEAHVLGFEGDLYGRSVRLGFVERLRSEKQFPGLEDLRQQLEADSRATRRIVSARR